MKATLLCASSVKRIVPEDYTPEDDPKIRRYTEIKGPNGALLQAVPAFSEAAFVAQAHLLEQFREHESVIENRYSRLKAPLRDEYWIHVAKFSDQLLEYLRSRNLAWRSEHSKPYGHRTWYALHPVLGSAVMTTLGLSIAKEQGYDIVTPSTEFHEMLLANREGQVLDALLDISENPEPFTAQVRNKLGQMVIDLTGVNYEALRPEHIPELQASKSFSNFQKLIRSAARSIDANCDPNDYREQLEDEAGAIVQAWHDTSKDVGRSMQSSLFESGIEMSGDALAPLSGSSKDIFPLVVRGAIAVVIALRKGIHSWRRKADSPYQYLTRIVKKQDRTLRMTFPLGLER